MGAVCHESRTKSRVVGSPHTHHARKAPQVCIGEPRVLGLDALEHLARNVEARVRTVPRLRSVAHRRAVAATRPALLVVRASSVPREANKDRAVGTVVVVVILEAVMWCEG